MISLEINMGKVSVEKKMPAFVWWLYSSGCDELNLLCGDGLRAA